MTRFTYILLVSIITCHTFAAAQEHSSKSTMCCNKNLMDCISVICEQAKSVDMYDELPCSIIGCYEIIQEGKKELPEELMTQALPEVLRYAMACITWDTQTCRSQRCGDCTQESICTKDMEMSCQDCCQIKGCPCHKPKPTVETTEEVAKGCPCHKPKPPVEVSAPVAPAQETIPTQA